MRCTLDTVCCVLEARGSPVQCRASDRSQPDSERWLWSQRGQRPCTFWLCTVRQLEQPGALFSTPTCRLTAASMAATGGGHGRVVLQGRSSHQGVFVFMSERTTVTYSYRSFRLDDGANGIQELQALVPAYSRHRVTGKEVHGGQVTLLPDVTLRAGDVIADSTVNLFDLVAVASRYGDPGPASSEDVLGDGQVDLFDLLLVGGNHGASAAGP